MINLENRIPPPLVALVCAAIGYGIDRMVPAADFAFVFPAAVWLLPLALGLALDIYSVALFFKHKTTIDPLHPDRSAALVIEGFYRFSRNPMYLGMALILSGLLLLIGNWLSLLALLLFLGYMNRFQIAPEERFLTNKFGPSYTEYCRRVRRWI